MASPAELHMLCDRARQRLDEEPPDRPGLLDTGTVMMFVARELHRAVVNDTAGYAITGERRHADAALARLHAALERVQMQRDTASDAEIHACLVEAVHSAKELVSMLEEQ